MNRRITYATQQAISLFSLQDQNEQMFDLSTLLSTIAGHATDPATPSLFNGFFCTPTTVPSLVVNVSDGAIFTQQDVDATDFGTAPSLITADDRQIMKFAYKLDPTQFTFVVPVTGGQSRNDLIQISFEEADGDPTSIPFFGGVNNVTVLTPTGTAVIPVANNSISDTVDVERLDNVIINVKQGTPAPTGTQVTPTPDSGFVGAWIITTTNGVSTITTGDITRYTDSSLTGDYETSAIIETLPEKISIFTADQRYARKSQIQFNSGVVNGGMTIAQRQPFDITASTLGIGLVDTMMGQVTGTTVTAGTLTQGTAQNYSSTGYTTHFSGITTTGLSTLTTINRIESNDAVNYLNKTVSLSVGVNHDFGTNANFQLSISIADAKNDFSTVTSVDTGGIVVVPTGTPTLLTLENISIGDCTNGIQIYIACEKATGMTTKNLHIYDMQLNTGEVADPFYPQDETTTRLRCMRRYQKSYDDGVLIGAIASPGAQNSSSVGTSLSGYTHTVQISPMLKIPTITIYNPDTGTAGEISNTAGNYVSAGASGTCTKSFVIQNTAAVIANEEYYFHYQAIVDL